MMEAGVTPSPASANGWQKEYSIIISYEVKHAER